MMFPEIKIQLLNSAKNHPKLALLIKQYWMLDPNSPEKLKFKYRVKDLSAMYSEEFSTSISTTVQKNSIVSANHPGFFCSCCGTSYKTNERKSLIKQMHLNSWRCRHCVKKETNSAMKKYTKDLEEKFLSNSVKGMKTFDVTSLSYLEKILILCILDHSTFIEKLHICSYDSNYSLTGSKDLDEQLFQRLLSNKVLTRLDSEKSKLPTLFLEAKNFMADNDWNVDPALESKLYELRACFNSLNDGFYVHLDNKSSTLCDLILEIHKDIENTDIDLEDIKELEYVIDMNLLEKSYELLEKVQSEFRFPVAKNERLKTIMTNMMSILTYEQSYSLMRSEGKRSAQTIKTNRENSYKEFNSFQENHIFCNRLDALVKKNERGEIKSYYKSLPIYLNPSKFEIYTSLKFIGGHSSWISFNGFEIKKFIIESLIKS